MLILQPPLISLGNIGEESRITTAPSVDRLFYVADIKNCPPPLVVLPDFFYEGLQSRPLGTAGILELVQQPMVKPPVQPVGQSSHLHHLVLRNLRQVRKPQHPRLTPPHLPDLRQPLCILPQAPRSS